MLLDSIETDEHGKCLRAVIWRWMWVAQQRKLSRWTLAQVTGHRAVPCSQIGKPGKEPNFWGEIVDFGIC